MHKTLWGVLVVSGLWAGQAAAVNTEGHDIPYFAAQYAREFNDSSRKANDGNGYQLTFGVPLNWDRTALELTFFDVGRNRALDGKKDYQTVLTLDLVRDLGLFGWDSESASGFLPRFKPFGLAGVGAVEEDVLGSKHLHLGGNLGVGILFPTLFHGWAVRTEARVQMQQNDQSVPGEDILLDYRLMLGLQIPLTPFFDKDTKAAPDKECKLSVVSTKTGRQDCGVDSDHDGIPDGADQCPGTPLGVPVDGKGCATGEAVVLKGVQFETDSARLTEKSKEILNGVAATLTAPDAASVTVEIDGHTDSRASEAYNLMLSQQRAESVRQYLISKGVPAKRLLAKGYGESQPRASNKTEKGRQENRRVEFKIVVE